MKVKSSNFFNLIENFEYVYLLGTALFQDISQKHFKIAMQLKLFI